MSSTASSGSPLAVPYSTYRIDATHVTATQYNDEATWNYDSTAEKH
jgi:hypothetical protein